MKRVYLGLAPFIMLATMGTPAVQATVETGLPAGTPNSCHSPDDFFLDFEAGIDEIEIESTIPSLQFTTTGALNWKYGDIRTNKYNVNPYGDGAYETNGNFFAWLGTLGDQGRIDFLGGGATYASALISTSSGLIIDAYDSAGSKIADSGWAGSNTGTGTFTRLTVEAPAGQTIAYIMIHDTGNFWLIDDLCTDANKAVIPVPGRDIGSHSDRFDLVFVPDVDYGSAADIDTWLPDFIDDIQDQIDQRLDAAAPVTGNMNAFNFYYTKMQGNAATDPHTLPTDITRVSPFADAYSILHNATFGDWTQWGPPITFGAEGAVGRSFIHEAGHGVFGLADEYDDAPACTTGRFEPSNMPNVWATEASGRADATNEGWDPDDIWQFTTCAGGWWKLGTTQFIMFDGNFFANGWGDPSARHIEWFLDQYPGVAPAAAMPAGAGEADKSIWLDIQVSAGAFSLLKDSYIVDAAPDYRSGANSFKVKVFSNGNALLKEFGIHDPRAVQAESDYSGPAWRDNANFKLIVPYYPSIGRVDLIESASGELKLSSDVSKYATVQAPIAICQDHMIVLDDSGNATITAADVDGGSYDQEGGDISLSIDKSAFSCADIGENSVTLTVTNAQGAPAACSATVTVMDLTAPVIQCNNPASITPPDAPISFMATATDNCAMPPSVMIQNYDCFKFTSKGKRIDKTESCAVAIAGNTLTITDSGGVNDNISWQVTATDDYSNTSEATCSIMVANPGN